MSFDWGSASPFSCDWFAVSDGSISTIPRGALVQYRQWYGAESANKGLKLRNEDIAKEIKNREKEQITYRIADPSIFEHKGGISIAEQMMRCGVTFQRGDNKRLAGWAQVRSRLIGQDDVPMLYIFASCYDATRTFPAAQHDRHNPEDLDTEGEDHYLDSLRYACMSRPYVRDAEEKEKPLVGLKEVTYGELMRAEEKRNSSRH
jgi:hypothetical protein